MSNHKCNLETKGQVIDFGLIFKNYSIWSKLIRYAYMFTWACEHAHMHRKVCFLNDVRLFRTLWILKKPNSLPKNSNQKTNNDDKKTNKQKNPTTTKPKPTNLKIFWGRLFKNLMELHVISFCTCHVSLRFWKWRKQVFTHPSASTVGQTRSECFTHFLVGPLG